MGINLNLDLTQQPKVVLQVKMMGVYAAGTTYAVGDAVTYNGGTYYMHTAAAAGTAPTDTAAWQAINSPNDYVESLTSFTLTNTSADNTISIDQNGNVGTDVTTDGAVHIENTGNTGIGLGVYTNIGATADCSLVIIKADNTAFDQNVLDIVNDGTGKGLFIDQNGNARALDIDSVATSAASLVVSNNGVHTGTTFNSVAFFRSDNASSTGTLVALQNDGSGAGISIDQNGNGNAIDIDQDGNSASTIFGLKITVDNAGSGNLVGGIDFSSMSDGEPLFKLTSTDTDLSTKSPETDAESGWFPVVVGTTVYAVPIYALS